MELQSQSHLQRQNISQKDFKTAIVFKTGLRHAESGRKRILSIGISNHILQRSNEDAENYFSWNRLPLIGESEDGIKVRACPAGTPILSLRAPAIPNTESVRFAVDGFISTANHSPIDTKWIFPEVLEKMGYLTEPLRVPVTGSLDISDCLTTLASSTTAV
jgi:hypothetical protein